ncbi:hypothetical protein ABEB36_006892 [Hypothenemus hampei]|uniref:Ricin B lectin domain-containing protein n=1 Tax=Hypothenemus hampei TaxID=57062 RepID=A0ABD1ES51_HYPHA
MSNQSSKSSTSTYTQSSYASSCDCHFSYEEEQRRLRYVICLKWFFIIFTLLGGGILALCINVIGRTMRNNGKETNGGNTWFETDTYGQLKNIETGLCLDDGYSHTSIAFSKFNKTSKLIIKPCLSSNAFSQYFKYNVNTGELGKANVCLDSQVVVQKHRQLRESRGRRDIHILKCSGKDTQAWDISKNGRVTSTGLCLSAKHFEEKKVIKAEICTENDNYQSWQFIPNKM